MKKFTKSHEWIEIEQDIGTVGITDHAQKELGEIVYVELPQIGKRVKSGEEAAVLESTKAAADVYSPMSGEIIETNHDLSAASGLINQSPESKGWIFKIKISNLSELDQLFDAESYSKMSG